MIIKISTFRGDVTDTSAKKEALFETVFTGYCALQIFEFLLTVSGIKGNEAAIESLLERVLYYTVSYMQMTADQQSTWSQDPNQYVADESDEITGARCTCELLLEELYSKFGAKATLTLNTVVLGRLGETLQLQASGCPEWWRLREAALFAIGTQVRHTQVSMSQNVCVFI